MEVYLKKTLGGYNIIRKEDNKILYRAKRKRVLGDRYTIEHNSKIEAEIVRNPYNIKKADIKVLNEEYGYISCDWTDRLDVVLKSKWYISDLKKGSYNIRSYGKIVAKVLCKYSLDAMYVIQTTDLDLLIYVCSIILALDIINYDEENF